MKVYLVGGAVRDELLGIEVKERDWVVVGSTPEEMFALGYKSVGSDFPVFIHPKTGEEYALARTERKTGKGYKGFVFDADPSVTLEEDLARRDLTINAMAKTSDGQIIDPFNGQADLKAKILRHVSDAFAEDPVRILRIARFAARFEKFTIDVHTLSIMKKMVQSGEVDALVPERVWKECYRALTESSPWRFFETLAECNALAKIFPEISLNQMSSLHNIVSLTDNTPTRFAALTLTLTLDTLNNLCSRMRVPTDYQSLALLAVKYHPLLSNINLQDAEQIVSLFEKLDCYRRTERLHGFVLACVANNAQLKADTLLTSLEKALTKTSKIDVAPFLAQGLRNEQIGEAVRIERVKILSGK